MALTLARPEGNGPGGRGLALFYLELRDEDGRLDHITINRLKDKLGTRKVPTAELTLDGAPAIPVMGLDNGVRNIIPMLHLTRTWNSVMAAADDAPRRWRWRATTRGGAWPSARRWPSSRCTSTRWPGSRPRPRRAFHLSFFLVELLGRDEAGDSHPRRRPAAPADLDRQADHRAAGGGRRLARCWRPSAARATSRIPACRCCCAIARCCPSGKGRPTSWRWTRCEPSPTILPE